MQSSSAFTGAAAAAAAAKVANDVQMAQRASPLAPPTAATTAHAAPTANTTVSVNNTMTGASAAKLALPMAPALHCQAAVVHIGEMFAEFACSIFRADDAHEELRPLSAAAMKRVGANGASTRSAARLQRDAAASASASSRLADGQHDSPFAAAAAAPSAAELGVPVKCAADDVPRWELLVYAMLHEEHGGGAAGTSGSRGRRGADNTRDVAADAAADGAEADDGAAYEESPVPNGAKVYFQQTMSTAKLTKVMKLDAGRRYTVRVRCYHRGSVRWSPWSAPIQTATLFPVETQIVEIGSDYVHCTWDRAAQRNEDGLAREMDVATTEWARSIPDFELRLLRESDMAEHYLGAFEAGCRSVTIRDLQPGTRYIVLMRYRTMIRTMREWTEVTRLVTESPLEVHLTARGEDTFTFSWGRGAAKAAAAAAAAKPASALTPGRASDPFLNKEMEEDAAVVDAFGYLQPRMSIHEYELTVESVGLRFAPITVPASVHQYTMTNVFPSTNYSICVRALSAEGRWGGRSTALKMRTADRPSVAVAAVGESFASFAWSRAAEEEPQESQLQYRVLSLTSAYQQSETIDLVAVDGRPRRLLNVDHLRSGSDYTVSMRIAIAGTWGLWTEPRRFTTAPSVALTFLERGEDFLTLNWPPAGLAPVLKRDDGTAAAEEPLPVYNVVVVKVDGVGERTAVLNERVTRDPTQRGFRVNDLEADTTYDVQCRTWQRNPMTGFEGWGELSAPVRMRTLQPVALHVWDVGEDFIHIMWRRGLSESAEATLDGDTKAGEDGGATSTDWDHLKYEVVMGCADTGKDSMLHRQVLDTSYTVTQLTPSTTYTIAVRACDEQGQWGLWSRVKVRTLASVKTTIHEIGEDFVRLVWQRLTGRDDADLRGVTVADMFVAKYSVLVYGRELPGIPVAPHVQSGYEAGGGRSDIVRHDIVSSEHTSLRVDDLLPDREYVAVVRAATSSGRWGLWSQPVRFRTNPQFRIPTHQLTIGENYVNVAWSRGDTETPAAPLPPPAGAAGAGGAATTASVEEGRSEDNGEVQLGDWTVTGQELRISGVTTQYAKQYALDADVRELKVCELLPACAYTIQIRVRGRSGNWGLWSAPASILTRGTLAVTTDEVAEDFITVRWERRKVANPHQYPTGRGVVTSYHLRVYNTEGVRMETFLGDGDCPYRVTGLKANAYYCVELKANYNDEEWGLWSVPLWCLTMQPMRIQAKLISEEFCCLQLIRPNQQRRLPEDDGNPPTNDRVLAHGRLRPTIMLCVTSPILSKAPYNSAAPAAGQPKSAYLNDALPPNAAHQRLIYQTELLNSAETVEHTVPNLKCNTVYSVSVRTKLTNGEWGMWSPSLVFATVPATRVSFTSIGENFVGVEWVRHSQVVPPQIANQEQVVLGVATITASRVRVRESGGAYQHTYTVEGATNTLRIDNLTPATTYMVCVQTFNDNYEWGVWSEEQKVRTVPGMDIHVQHVSEDALWVSWSRRTDLHVVGDANTAFNVNIAARAFEVCLIGEGGFTYTQETDSTSLFFRGLMPDAVYTIHVRALFAQSEYWGLWSAQPFRTKPRLRVTFGNIGEHFVMLEWRRHLPKPTDTDARMLADEDDINGGYASEASLQSAGNALMPRHPLVIAETEDVVQLYRFRVQRVGEPHSVVYNIAPTVSGFRLRDLQPSSEYRVWVCAKGYEGVWGFWSEESRVRTLPRLTLEVLNIGEDYVRAQWRRGAWEGASMSGEDGTEVRQVDGAVSGYEIRVIGADGSVAAMSAATFRETSAVLSGLRLSTRYAIQVRAKDTYDAWGLWSDPISFYTLKPVTVALQRVCETFVDVQWARPMDLAQTQHERSDSTGAEEADESSSAAGMHVDKDGVLHPDERVTRWHMRVTCNRVFAGMPQTEDYRELYADEGEHAMHIDGLLPQATYSIAVRGLNHAGEWGHWSPALVVVTCPLLKVAVEVAGETFLQLAWIRPSARGFAPQLSAAGHSHTPHHGYIHHLRPHRQHSSSAPETASDGDDEDEDGTESDLQVGEGGDVHIVDGLGGRDDGSDHPNGDADADGNYSALPSFVDGPAETYVCFPSEAEVHNYQVTIKPMPAGPPFDEADEPLVDGARVYETTQPSLRLGNLLPGTRYAITVREQQSDDEGRLVAGEWGAPSEAVCTLTVPPVQIIPQEIGEDYCMVEWRRAAVADSAADGSLPFTTGGVAGVAGAAGTTGGGGATGAGVAVGGPAMLTAAASTTASQKVVEFQLQTRRMHLDGTTLYEGALAMDSVVSVPSSVNMHHIAGLVPSSVYEVRVRAKMESAQWGMWSPATRFMTQSRLELRVDRVQEVTVRVSWHRPRLSRARSGSSSSRPPLERRDRSSTTDQLGEDMQEESNEEVDSVEAGEATTSELACSPVMAEVCGSHVIQPEDAVHEYELVIEGISVPERRRLTFSHETQYTLIEELQQENLYCLSIRSLSEKKHWSRFSAKATLLTLSSVVVRVAQHTECTALLEWSRPAPDVSRYSELLARHQRDALHQCDDRERRELLEMKRKIQEQESKGESTTAATAGWMNPAAREEHNALLREEATRHYQADRIAVGNPACTGYELRVTMQRGELCVPYIAAIETLRAHGPSGLPVDASAGDFIAAARRSGHNGPMSGSGGRGAAGNTSFRDRKRDGSMRVPPSPGTHSGASLPIGTTPGQVMGGSQTLLSVQLRSAVTQVLLQGLSPDAVFSARVRARGVPNTWQPWSRSAKVETLPLIQLDQSRFGEHYINLYWYRGEAAMMASVAQEAEEFRRLQREFHNLTERGLDEQRNTLGPSAYASLVNRLRRLRILRRLSAARAKRHADGETGLLADPACPVQGYQLRVIDEAGTFSEHYLPNNQFHDPSAPPTLGFTATGLQPNSMYVCCLCPHYGGDVWGCWTAPLKYMTHNIIQLDITYISETFVDLEWWRLDNKPVSALDEHDTLLSSRYTEEVQVYQLRITHEDAVTGQEVEEFRNMRACNVLRIDALLPDMKYTIAVREWDPKGDWGLWSATCSCVTLPSIETTVADVKECSAQLSWRRATPCIDYENDMHVLEDSSEIIGFYLRMEEVPRRATCGSAGSSISATTAAAARPLSGASPTTPMALSEHPSEALSMSVNDVGMLNTSFDNATAPADEKPRTAEADELEGTLAFGFQRGGPLPPEAHPQLHDGLVTERAERPGGAPARQHYLLVKRITSSTELQACLADLHPQTAYQVQIMAETTGGQVGPWSAPHFFITTPQLRLSAATIDEHYVSLQWLRRPLAPIAAQLGARASFASTVGSAFPSTGSGGNSKSGGGGTNGAPNPLMAPAQVTLPTARVVAYELEVRGGPGHDFAFSTRIDSGAANGAFRVTGLSLDSPYVARVRSFSDAGEASLWSAELAFVTLRQLLVQPQEITESTIEMSWSRPEQKPELYLSRTSFNTAPVTAQATPPLPPTQQQQQQQQPSADATGLPTLPVTLAVPPLARSRPTVCVGDREAVKYQVRVYHATEQAPPRMLVDKQLNGNVTRLPVNSLIPNSVYLLYVRAINRDGVWSEWSDGRCVYTMKPLLSSIATVGEDFVRVQWARDAPEELHYTPGAAATASTAGASISTAQKHSLATAAASATTVPSDGAGVAAEVGTEVHDGVPLAEDDGGAGVELPTSVAERSTTDSPNAARTWLQGRRFRLQDRPAEASRVYCSAATSIDSFNISVRRSDEAEGYTVEVPGHTCQHTLRGLQPDSIYLICVRAQYSSTERGPWSDIVRSGTYNLLAMDLKEVGEDYVASTWQRKPNTINMASLHIGKVEETVCYEVRVRDYTEVPLGEEESELAQRRDSESRSVFLHANQRHSILRELLSNHRYRLSVRRWYQPHDGFSVKGDQQQSNGSSTRAASIATSRNSMSNTAEGSRDSVDEELGSRQTEEVQVPSLLASRPTALQAYAQTAHVVMDAALRESMERAKALPGVWSDSEYVVTLRDMVCTVERVGEEYFQLRWGRDPRAAPLPVRRAMPVKPVQNFQLRIDELLRDGSAVEGTRGTNTVHLDELMAPTETSYFSNTLKPNTLYKIEVRCCIEKLWGRWSRPVYVITQPCLQVEVSRIGEECATIAWHRPREPLTLPDGEVAILGDEEEADGSYQLEVNGIGFNYQISRRFKASRTSYTVRHLDADALYAVRVRSGDGMHQACSLWSETSCFATLKPIQVVLSMPTEQFVHVEWKRPPQTAEEYAERLEQQAGVAAGASSGTSAPQPTLSAEGQAGGSLATPVAGAAAASTSAVAPPSQPSGAAVPRVGGTVQLGNPGSLAFHLCVFNTQETPSLAVVDKQFHKDVSHHRVVGLVADTPYVVIVRACCEATGDWGLWSEERHFRSLKLLAPIVCSVGETYAELTWEHSDTEQLAPGAGAGAPAVPTKYLLVLRSTRDGTFEREITAEECRGAVSAMTPDNYQSSSYRLTHLQPGTEYAVALQPCYGGSGDWGLWSQAASFTTLQAVQLSATLTKDAMDLSWGRSVPAPSFVLLDGAAAGSGGTTGAGGDGAVRLSQDGGLPSPPAAALPAAGSHTAAGTALANSRTVSRYQLVVYRAEDIANLYPHGSSLDASLAQAPSSNSLLFPAVAASQDGQLSNRPPASSTRRSSGLRAQQQLQLMRSSITTARLQSSFSGPLDAAGANATQTAIPDMDVGGASDFDGSAAMPVQQADWLFRKQYDVSDSLVPSSAQAPLTSGAAGGGAAGAAPGGQFITVSGMHERIEGLTPDTTYLVRLRAMDLFGHWGTPVEVRLVTPPLAPMQVALRRVNGQFCSLQWTTPGVAAADGAAGVNAHGRYRYVVEQCVLQTEPPAPSGPGVLGGIGGGGFGGRKTGGPNAASAAATALLTADWHVVDTVEDTNVCAVRIAGLLSRMRCRVKCARHVSPAPQSANDVTAFTAPAAADTLGPYSDYSDVVAVSSGTPPEGVVDPHLSTLSQNAATLEWLPPPKPSEAAAGRYARPVYHVYLANTTDQPYPVQIATVHRPTYVLTNLTPATTYTVQVVAENSDGVSYRNPILRFTTKAEDDQTVSRHDEGSDSTGGAADAFVPLAEIVPFHGPRAAQAEEEAAAAAAAAGADVADIPTAARRSIKPAMPPSARQRGGRGGAAKGGRGSSAGKRKGGAGRKLSSRGRSASGAGAKRSSSGSGKPVGTETVRENTNPVTGFLPSLAKTL